MRIAYLDCFAGIAGDMFLGALVDAGVPLHVLENATAALNIGASLKVEKVDRSGISSTRIDVVEDGHRAEEQPFTRQPEQQHQHKIGHEHAHAEEHAHADPKTTAPVQEMHSDDPPRTHSHGRSLTVIRSLIQASPLAAPVKQTAIGIFELLGSSEAKIHNVPIDDIHFHEVGAVDAIVDIVAASAGIHHLGVDAWYCSAINVGGGTVVCAHGTFPVPAPATADLLRGMPTYSAHIERELVTPTGAAILRALDPVFGPQPGMRVDRIGYGAGTRNPQNFPNVVRLSMGEASDVSASVPLPARSDPAEPAEHPGHSHAKSSDSVTVLETALDDLSPQVLAYVAETALASGALDVMLTPVIMKKGRPGTLLTILCNPSDSSALEHLILTETSSLGVRIRQDRRSCLDRSHTTVATPYGAIRIKIGSRSGKTLNAAPEFEDCRAAAALHRASVKQVQQAAIAAYIQQHTPEESQPQTS